MLRTIPQDGADGRGAIDAGLVTGLVRMARLVQDVFSRVSAEHDLTAAQARLLCVLAEGPKGMGELADILGVEKAAMTGLVDRVERGGLLERTAVPGDRRACHVRLTAPGGTVAMTVHDAICQDLEALVARLPATRRDQLGRSLLEIARPTEAGPRPASW